MFPFNSKKNEFDNSIKETYQNIIERSRSKFFYLSLDLQDTFESRFDMIILHAFLIFYYFKGLEENQNKFAQLLFDYMFSDFDSNLREMGFGDIAVNKKMKIFISAFYGRIANYSKGIDAIKFNNNYMPLKEAIKNNIYKGKIPNDNFLSFFCDYMVKNIDCFTSQSEQSNLKENFKFIGLPKIT